MNDSPLMSTANLACTECFSDTYSCQWNDFFEFDLIIWSIYTILFTGRRWYEKFSALLKRLHLQSVNCLKPTRNLFRIWERCRSESDADGTRVANHWPLYSILGRGCPAPITFSKPHFTSYVHWKDFDSGCSHNEWCDLSLTIAVCPLRLQLIFSGLFIKNYWP